MKRMPNTTAAWRCLPLVVLLVAAPLVHAQEELAKKASWSIPSAAEIRAQLDAFLAHEKIDAVKRAKIDALWPTATASLTPDQVLDRVVATFTVVDPAARELFEFCRQTGQDIMPREFPVLTDPKRPVFERANLRLYYGRWLAQHQFYDEALEQLKALPIDQVVDPAALLFYQSAGYHRMLNKKACLKTVAKLLENETRIPRRYATVAKLMQADLAPLKTDSLDEISRLMSEVKRRLYLSRAGQRVRKQEDDILKKLDKIIKKLEQQQQKQAGGGSLQPSNPAQDSMPMGGTGPGNVDPKHIGNKSGWGNLPPKQRQEALQQIGKDLPAHYREVIEEYFRRLAREQGK